MKIVHLNTFDEEGGAARAASRLHRGLLQINIESLLIVQNKISDKKKVFLYSNSKFSKFFSLLRAYVDVIPLLLYRNRKKTPWSVAWLPSRIQMFLNTFKPDIVHLHWIVGGFLGIHTLKNKRMKYVWTLHDSWPLTGGCHVPADCEKFKDGCNKCPQLRSSSKFDLSWLGSLRKEKLYTNQNIVFVAPSRWMAQQARESSLLKDYRIEVIPNGLDTSVFCPVDKKIARKILGLDIDKKIILFGAMSATSDKNKGYEELRKSLIILREKFVDEDLELVIFGASEPEVKVDVNYKTTYLGRLYDDVSLAIVYSAADLICIPSLQESFGQTASEAMACGTPVVAFSTSGLMDIVEHKITGYLARAFDEIDFAEGIRYLLSDQSRLDMMSKAARERACTYYDISIITQQYLKLYKDI